MVVGVDTDLVVVDAEEAATVGVDTFDVGVDTAGVELELDFSFVVELGVFTVLVLLTEGVFGFVFAVISNTPSEPNSKICSSSFGGSGSGSRCFGVDLTVDFVFSAAGVGGGDTIGGEGTTTGDGEVTVEVVSV